MLHKQKEKYWRLYFPSKDSMKLKKIIEPLTIEIPSMKLKMSNIMPKK